MHFSKNLQYAVSGVLAVYIVFFTRPAPQMVVNLLSSPIAQLAALAGIVYVGASVSLLVALVAAVALVLSIPAREYLDAKQMTEDNMGDAAKKLMDVGGDVAKAGKDAAVAAAAGEASKKLGEVAKKDGKKEPPPMSAENPVSKPSDGKAHFTNFAPF
jgi:hypothetical protein